ncbi:hypothetical protein PIB30_041593 [Stylosanthes scabra]|uniref:DUF4283 domain-containing protein n=1 Tax=Stylosanthes scabra TaxID=79078 RepID=A0ABU6UF57_9FABA|nr:hypothetical protein [Stylosanthes scabra]
MENSNAHPIEGKEIIIEQGNYDGFTEQNLHFVAKIISDKELSFRTIKAALMGIWGRPKGVSITDVGVNKVLISFQDQIKGLQFSKGSPWSIRGCLVNMHPWSGNKSVLEVNHKKIELWIQMHGIPFTFVNKVEEEEQRAEEEDKQSKEIELEIIKLKARLDKLKGKKVMDVEQNIENSYSVNLELIKGEARNGKEWNERCETNGDFLEKKQVEYAQQKNMDVIITEIGGNEEKQEMQIGIQENEDGNMHCQLPDEHEMSEDSKLGGEREYGKELMVYDTRMEEAKVNKYRAKPKAMYFVEMPEDSGDELEKKHEWTQPELNQEQWKELALYMETVLILKRKRQDDN